MGDEFIGFVLKAKQYNNYHDFYQNYGRIYCKELAPMVWDAKIRDDFLVMRNTLEPCENEKALLNQYQHSIRIQFMGAKLTIPYDAVAYNALIDALNIIEKEI